MSNNLIKKVNYILNRFFNGDENYLDFIPKDKKYFKKPKIWNVDTDLFMILERLSNNVKEFNKVEYIDIINSGTLNKKGNPLYYLEYNGKNITPAKQKKLVSESAIRQYCQLLTSLNIFMYDSFDNNSFRLECNYLKEVLSKIDEFGISIIYNGQKSAIDWVRNLGYSLFLSLLFYKNYDFNNLDKEFKIIEKRKTNEKSGLKFFHIAKKMEEIEKMYNETYKYIIKKNFDQYELEYIIDNLYTLIKYSDDEYEILQQIEKYDNDHKIKLERSRFKSNIFNDRCEKKLINSVRDIYSDLVSEKNNLNLVAKFHDLHACHIYEVKDIRKYGKNISDISNPNNGIMMKSEYHWAFDKGLFIFDEKGKISYRKSDEEYLFKILNLVECRIREEVLNNDMINYLKKRNF